MKGKPMPQRGQAMGLGKAAEMSGRAMPTTGRRMNAGGAAGRPANPGATGLAKAAEMSGRTMPATGRRFNAGGMATAMGRVPTQAGGGMDAAAAGMARRPVGMKKGGSIDGIAKKGKTHTKMVKMAKGGKAC